MARRTTKASLDGARVLITGGAGFIGTNVIAQIIDRCEVVVLDTLHRDALSLATWRRYRSV